MACGPIARGYFNSQLAMESEEDVRQLSGFGLYLEQAKHYHAD
jgi:hypothetical protein